MIVIIDEMITIQGSRRTMEFKPPLGCVRASSLPSTDTSKIRRNLFIMLFSIIVILILIIAFLSFFLALSLRAESESMKSGNTGGSSGGGSFINVHTISSKEPTSDPKICTSKACIKAGIDSNTPPQKLQLN